MPEPTPLTKRRKILFSLITLLVIVLSVELGLHLFSFWLSPGMKGADKSSILAFYQEQEWAPTLARESKRPKEYHQFLNWISKPTRGQYVNIDRETGRKTWNPGNLTPGAATVFLFGGSAAWGFGARDDYTIASQLSRRLNAKEPRFRVFNFGEPAFTFTQGVLYLIIKLREGFRPQYVIFYDGFNDVYGAYQSGRAGTLHNVPRTREKLESKPRQIYWQAVKEWFAEHCYLYNKVFFKMYLHFHPEKRYQEAGAGLNEGELKDLAAGVVREYARSAELLDHLSRAYGFQYLCLWQPVLYTESTVLPGEFKTDVRLGDKKFGQLYRFTNQDLARQSLPHFVNLADAVSSRTRPCYLDLVHMSEEGYALVAERLFQVWPKAFSPGSGGPP